MSRINPRTAGSAGAALLAMSIAFIGAKEGFRSKAYRDSVGVATACYGETKGIKMGMRFTKAQCDAMFAKRLDADFAKALEACVPDARDPDEMSNETYVSFLSMSYNIGSGSFCRSSVAKRWNAGDHHGACDAMLRYVYGRGHRYLPGLANRRRSERAYCLNQAD